MTNRLQIEKKHVGYIFLFLCVLIALSCKKQAIEKSDSKECISLKPCKQIGFGYQYDVDFVKYYSSPYFNPTNENEFLYLKKYTPTYQSSELYTYNILTNEKQLIYSGSIIYSPKWGPNGWIIFSKQDGEIYKIKGDGEGLTKLTMDGCYHYPEWYFDQDQFVAYNACLGVDILFNADGVALDTLPKLIGPTSSLAQAPYMTSNSLGVRFYNYETNNFDFIYDYSSQVNNSANGGSVFYTSTNEVVYSHENGLNKLTIPSLTSVNFRRSCNSKVYLFGSVNSSKTRMIWSRGDYDQVDECTLKFKSNIYIMNMDASDETIINFE